MISTNVNELPDYFKLYWLFVYKVYLFLHANNIHTTVLLLFLFILLQLL